MKYIYLFLSRTGTRIADLIGAFTGDRYTHVSIALDRELEDMYSFARRGIHNPLYSGFEKENIHKGIFALFGDGRCRLYRLAVTDDTYRYIEDTLHAMYEDKHRYRYNFIGLVSCAFGIPANMQHHYTCSQFVSWMLESSGAAEIPKNMGLMKPEDLTVLKSAELIYEGSIKDADQSSSAEYMPPIPAPFVGIYGRKD